jgi:hypothetical protein
VSKGTPDMFIRPPSLPPLLWSAVELKGSCGTPTAEQQALAHDRAIVIVRTWVEVRAAVALRYVLDRNITPRAQREVAE